MTARGVPAPSGGLRLPLWIPACGEDGGKNIHSGFPPAARMTARGGLRSLLWIPAFGENDGEMAEVGYPQPWYCE